jgi:ABC-type polysaccharide/polyol phosphate transport system ATPase subunit
LNDRNRLFEFFGGRQHHDTHWALQDVSFEIPKGRSFGLIGPNGAGKSTLLRILAGISQPTSGEVQVQGSLSTLLDLEVGFHDDFTGRQNIALNCGLLGVSRAEIAELGAEIIAFAELDRFIDFPVRTYSTGMRLRLGFAVAAHVNADLLLIDEVLTVGDQYVQRKCIRKIESFKANGGSIALVSHDLHAVRNLCDDVMWLDGGRSQAIGPAKDVVGAYIDRDRSRIAQGQVVFPFRSPKAEANEELPAEDAESAAPPAPTYQATLNDPDLQRAIIDACVVPNAKQMWDAHEATETYETYDGEKPVVIGSGETRVLEVRVLDGLGRPRQRFRSGDTLVVAVTFRTTEPVEDPIFGVALFRNDDVYIHGPNTRYDGVLDGRYHGVYTFFAAFPQLPLLAGTYRASIAIFDKSHLKPHVWHNQLYEFEVSQDAEDHGMVRLDHAWGLITHHDATDE